ncbi:glycosyltransferase [Arenicella xantha]|uniref:Glycosyl transferase family 2 n=1 Tax=Arenicella xantha TaxID=644221 RepID=A0A395JMR6_9GAMM|nr:glycosyltransferase [Arenicella xantha]RBP52951.1 glycosyl transferase family 2 [Arenicella xantha]
MATVIIAACNEASIIRDTLSALIEGCENRDYQILVICNGCSDDTEKIIQQDFADVICVSLEQASKSLAIRFAESLSPGFPRLYLDADIILATADAKALFDAGTKQEAPALIVPSSTIITQQSQMAVKRFYKVWYNTPFVQQLGYGAGAYLLNQAGRKRFNEWPRLIADDGFVRSQFNTSEIHILHSLKVIVKAPLTTSILIKVKARSKLGNLELKQFLNDHQFEDRHILVPKKTTESELETDSMATAPINAIDILIYKLVNIAALLLARWQFFTGNDSWAKDNSNR